MMTIGLLPVTAWKRSGKGATSKLTRFKATKYGFVGTIVVEIIEIFNLVVSWSRHYQQDLSNNIPQAARMCDSWGAPWRYTGVPVTIWKFR